MTRYWSGTAIPSDDGSTGPPGFWTPNGPFDLAVTDLNRDGHSDVIVITNRARAVSIRLGSAAGGFELPLIITTSAQPVRVRATDLDDDGFGDVVIATTRGVFAIFGHDDWCFLPHELFRNEGPSSLVAFDVADADADGRLDIVLSRHYTGGVQPAEAQVLFGDGTGAFTPGATFEIHPALAHVVDARVADLDDDGAVEIVASAYPNGLFVRSLGASASSAIPTPNVELALDVADFDRDGLVDLVAASSGTFGSLNVYSANGRGSFESPLRFEIGAEPGRFAFGDMDADGKTDVVTTTTGVDPTQPGAFELYINRSGAFRDAGTVNAGAGILADVVFVNGTTGGPRRFVGAEPDEPRRIDVLAPPAARRSVPFALFVWTADPNRGPGAALPHGIGATCLPGALRAPRPEAGPPPARDLFRLGDHRRPGVRRRSRGERHERRPRRRALQKRPRSAAVAREKRGRGRFRSRVTRPRRRRGSVPRGCGRSSRSSARSSARDPSSSPRPSPPPRAPPDPRGARRRERRSSR